MKPPRDPTTRLDECLAALARQPIPETPASLGAQVWREIRRHPTGPAANWVAALVDLFGRPSLAVPAFAVTIALGIFVGASSATSSTVDIRMAQRSLHLDVFASNAGGLPAALASHR